MNERNKVIVKAINLEQSTDRRTHIINQFCDKPEFSLCVVDAKVNERDAIGLGKTIIQIVNEEFMKGSDFFILCEDEHTFTEEYSFELLFECINQAKAVGADLLAGGYSWFGNAVQISKNLFWVDKFNGMKFTVIFQKFYQPILDTNLRENITIELSLSNITEHKFVIYPYISTQKGLGYSDVTLKNTKEEYVDEIYRDSMARLKILNKVKKNYFPNFK